MNGGIEAALPESITAAKKCRRCLLADMEGKEAYYASVLRYKSVMPQNLRTSDDEYDGRLAVCRQCKNLQDATCMQCGCYVEIRAARTDMHCPVRKW